MDLDDVMMFLFWITARTRIRILDGGLLVSLAPEPRVVWDLIPAPGVAFFFQPELVD